MRNSLMKIFWVFIGIILFLVVLSVVLSAIFVPRYIVGYPPYRYGMMGYGWVAWPWMGLMMIIPAILLIFFVWWIVEIATGGNLHGEEGREKTALDILNERLASGSITKEEYEKLKDAITRK